MKAEARLANATKDVLRAALLSLDDSEYGAPALIRVAIAHMDHLIEITERTDEAHDA